jgi:hypothetical protein
MTAPYNERPPPAEHREVVSTTRARQGVTGHNVRYVLAFGLPGAIVALALIYFYYFAT